MTHTKESEESASENMAYRIQSVPSLVLEPHMVDHLHRLVDWGRRTTAIYRVITLCYYITSYYVITSHYYITLSYCRRMHPIQETQSNGSAGVTLIIIARTPMRKDTGEFGSFDRIIIVSLD